MKNSLLNIVGTFILRILVIKSIPLNFGKMLCVSKKENVTEYLIRYLHSVKEDIFSLDDFRKSVNKKKLLLHYMYMN